MDHTDLRAALFEHLDEVRAGMLGVEGSHRHMQPMTHHTDRAAAELWFLSSSDEALVGELGTDGAGRRAHFCVIGRGHDFYACIAGRLEVVNDQSRIDELWSMIAAAWFPEGREDRRVTALRLTMEEAEVWKTTGNAALFGAEILRASLTGDRPDIGVHGTVGFGRG